MDLSGSACGVHTKTANVGGLNFHGQSGCVVKGNTLSRCKVSCGNPVRRVQVAASSGSCRAEPTSVADLSQLQPQLQHEWHPQKNQHLGTAQLNPYSFVKAIWRCPDCHHEWPARVIDRACNQAGCQQCAQRQSCAVVRCHSCLSGITSPMGSWEYSQTRDHRTVMRRCFGFATSVHRNGLMGGSSPHLTGLELLIHAVHNVMESKHASATMHLAESSPMHPEKIWYI